MTRLFLLVIVCCLGGVFPAAAGASFGNPDAIIHGYHLDGQGSPLALTDAAGAIEKTSLYGAFGEERYSTGASPSQLGYLARPLNPATKLHNFQARSYSASDGRFTQVDPIAGDLTRPQSLNPYAYGLSNPLKWEDSAGQFPIVSNIAGGMNAGWDAWWQSDIGVGTQMCRLAIPGCEYYTSDQLAKYGWDSEEFIRESGVDIALAAIPGGKILKAGEELNGARKALNAADELVDGGVPDVGKLIASAAKGRQGAQQRLREIANDPKAPSHIRGWIRSEQRQIRYGNRSSIRRPPGYQLAHRRGYEARKGFGYSHSDLNDQGLHRLQHQYEGYKR